MKRYNNIIVSISISLFALSAVANAISLDVSQNKISSSLSDDAEYTQYKKDLLELKQGVVLLNYATNKLNSLEVIKNQHGGFFQEATSSKDSGVLGLFASGSSLSGITGVSGVFSSVYPGDVAMAAMSGSFFAGNALLLFVEIMKINTIDTYKVTQLRNEDMKNFKSLIQELTSKITSKYANMKKQYVDHSKYDFNLQKVVSLTNVIHGQLILGQYDSEMASGVVEKFGFNREIICAAKGFVPEIANNALIFWIGENGYCHNVHKDELGNFVGIDSSQALVLEYQEKSLREIDSLTILDPLSKKNIGLMTIRKQGADKSIFNRLNALCSGDFAKVCSMKLVRSKGQLLLDLNVNN